MKKNQISRIIKISALILLCMGFFISCNTRVEQQSYAVRLELVDSLISHNQMKNAVSELKKISKKTYDSWTNIGIFKRFVSIGEKKIAEKIIKKAISKNPGNLELKAVYSKYLINENRVDEAAVVAEKLAATKYGSIYAECILRSAMKAAVPGSELEYFSDRKFYPVYMDAYTGSGNNIWLRNCAVINLLNGYYAEAVRYLPASYYEADDSYFWALALYDAGQYQECLNALDSSSYLLKSYENRNFFAVDDVKLTALKSDTYLALSDADSSEIARKEFISGLKEFDFAGNPADRKNSLMPVIFYNSAVYAIQNDDKDTAIDYLFVAVENWPDYEPALIRYAELAYELSIQIEEDSVTKLLREAGIKSLEMEKYDRRRKIPVSDAVYRLEQSYERTKNQALKLELLELKYKTETDLTQTDKTADIWKLLENNLTEFDVYSEPLVKYAICYFINSKQEDEAVSLFYKFLQKNYSFKLDDTLWDEYERHRKEIDPFFTEVAAWVCFTKGYQQEAIRFYEYCVYESSGILDEGELSKFCSSEAAMNLANIYYARGMKDKSLDLYGRIAGLETRNQVRSEIFYRIANIYATAGDLENAMRCADYAITLNEDNAKALLLRSKIVR